MKTKGAWRMKTAKDAKKKLRDFEEAEELAGKSGLTEQDVLLLSEKVNEAMGKHAKRLLNENKKQNRIKVLNTK